VSERKPYKTDLSDEQWALVEPVIAAWKAAHPGTLQRESGRARPEAASRLSMAVRASDTAAAIAAAACPACSGMGEGFLWGSELGDDAS
jgi:hypothetical protein